MSKPRISSRRHARCLHNRASIPLVALSLASFLFFFGAAVKSNAAARLTNSPRGKWPVRHQLEQPGHIGNGGSTLRPLDHGNQCRESLHQPDCGWRAVLSPQSNGGRHDAAQEGPLRLPGLVSLSGRRWSQWIHWSRSTSTIASNTLTFEMWPEMSEYTHKYAAPGFTYPGGAQAYLFSSQDQQTVDKHFDWMQDYGIDGVFLSAICTSLWRAIRPMY